ncbi:hypothetical protein VTN96DRAFT_10279 [Rasamsonia emersonii]
MSSCLGTESQSYSENHEHGLRSLSGRSGVYIVFEKPRCLSTMLPSVSLIGEIVMAIECTSLQGADVRSLFQQ